VAWLLVRLKLRLLSNALRSTTGAKVSFILSTIFAALVAIGLFTSLAALRRNGAAVDLTAVTFTTFAFGWLILPLLTFGLDATLDPATLALYPLRTRPLITGLIAASAAGAWPAANVIGDLGIIVGLAHTPFAVIVAIVAVALQVLFCITLARLVTTALAGLLRSRRGRDLAAVALIPLFALYETFAQVVPGMAEKGSLTAASFAGIDRWLRWLPPGLAAHAVADASAGDPGLAIARLAIVAAVIAALALLWARALGRALVTADASTQSAAVRGAGTLPFARSGLRGTITARFWLYQRRDPSALIVWGITAIVMVVVSVSTFRGQNQNPLAGVLLSAGFGGALVGAFHSNAVGTTGPAFAFEALALPDRRALRAWFAGQDGALAMVGLPLVIIIPFALAVITGHPLNGFLGIAVGLAATGAGLALSNVFTAWLPYPVERRAGSPTPRAAGGYTGHSLAGTLGSLVGVGVLIVPLILGVALTGSVAAAERMPALVAAGALWGALLCAAGVSIAARAAEGKLPELVQLANRSKL
jgi:ABC-2 type transport system permease protein